MALPVRRVKKMIYMFLPLACDLISTLVGFVMLVVGLNRMVMAGIHGMDFVGDGIPGRSGSFHRTSIGQVFGFGV